MENKVFLTGLVWYVSLSGYEMIYIVITFSSSCTVCHPVLFVYLHKLPRRNCVTPEVSTNHVGHFINSMA